MDIEELMAQAAPELQVCIRNLLAENKELKVREQQYLRLIFAIGGLQSRLMLHARKVQDRYLKCRLFAKNNPGKVRMKEIYHACSVSYATCSRAVLAAFNDAVNVKRMVVKEGRPGISQEDV